MKNYQREKIQKLWSEVKLYNILISIARKHDTLAIEELLEARNLLKAEIAYINYCIK